MNSLWWQDVIFYQIYPLSFKDSNDDGMGDLEGIIQKLDCVKSLGIGAIWLSPIYTSPMADFGYDVADYCNIDRRFGNLLLFDRLLEESHKRGMRVVMDFVPNHSSDRHPWFVESASSRDNPKRDWYIWRDPKPNGNPPNNWLSFFGGPAWTLDETTGQYYMHTFLPEQPELNWRNPKVREAMYNAMRFWFDREVDGFRIDVVGFLFKDEQFRDDPPNPNYITRHDNPYDSLLHTQSCFQPEVYDVLRAFRQVANEYTDRVLIGEVTMVNFEYLSNFYGEKNDRLHLPFNFYLLYLPWDAKTYRQCIDAYVGTLPKGAWPNYVLGNHDSQRLASRLGTAQARVAAMLLLTLRGTPFIYYGEELGMTNGVISYEKQKDPQGLRLPGIILNRDLCRTPMQWNSTLHAGFSRGEPWLPVAPGYNIANLQTEESDPHSFLSLYRRLAKIRREQKGIQMGTYRSIQNIPDECFVYAREAKGSKILVALNFSGNNQHFALSNKAARGRVILSTHLDREGNESLAEFMLRPHEGCIIAT